MDEAIYECVKKFTIEQLWEPRAGITPDTRLAEDIRIAGIDGRDFMEAYSTKFDVDISGFDWVDYFGPESVGCLLPLPITSWLGIYNAKDSLRWGRDPADFEISIRDLTEWASAGSWTPPHTRNKPANKTLDTKT